MQNQWMIKTFYKKSAVKALVLYPEKRLKVFWAIPNDGVIQLLGKAFVVNEKDFFLSNGIPAYIYDINNLEPKNPYDEETKNRLMTPTKLDTAISARVAKEIFEASTGALDKSVLSLILNAVVLLAVLGMGYMILDKIADMVLMLIDIIDKLNLINGGF